MAIDSDAPIVETQPAITFNYGRWLVTNFVSKAGKLPSDPVSLDFTVARYDPTNNVFAPVRENRPLPAKLTPYTEAERAVFQPFTAAEVTLARVNIPNIFAFGPANPTADAAVGQVLANVAAIRAGIAAQLQAAGAPAETPTETLVLLELVAQSVAAIAKVQGKIE